MHPPNGFPYRILVYLIFSLISIQTLSQSVSGRVIDSINNTPLPLASIRIFKSADKKLVNGSLATDSGTFQLSLPPGQYFAVIEFMGFRPYTTRPFTLDKNLQQFNVGEIKMTRLPGLLEEVTIQAEKSSMQLSLDKKVFNVGLDLANAGGSAVDILTNIPSVSVDPEGNVKLRGSDNVRILIDGKPSGLVSIKGGSGLQQLQANMIEKVEIITNPSARYEAEGMAGIINIILKKERKEGFNGTLELVMGSPTNLGAAANLNYRHKKVNFFINYSIAFREQPGGGRLYQEVYDMDS